MATTTEIVTADRDLQPDMYTKRGIALVRGEGAILWDADGNRYIDVMSNYGVNILGHAHPAVTEAISRQAGTLLNCHQSFSSDVRAEFLETLLGIAPDNMARVWLSNSGAEAIEAALKFARAVTGKTKMVALKNAYHGRTAGASDVTAPSKTRDQQEPEPASTVHVPFNNLDALDGAVDQDTAAIVLEPIQGEAGIHLPDEGFLTAAGEIARRAGALLILDEVQTAFRTGAFFAVEHDPVQADIICTAKALAGGVPIGATIMTGQIAESLPAGLHGSTFGGNPLACAAGLATIRAIQSEGLLEQSIALGEQLQNGIIGLDSQAVRAVRGRGLMIGIELRSRVTPVLRGLQERGVLALPAGRQVLRFLPPLVIQPAEIDQVIEALAETLNNAV